MRRRTTTSGARIVNFPDPTLEAFMAELMRTGSAITDFDQPSDVAPFRDRVRRACRRKGIRARTGVTDARTRGADGGVRWTYGRRVWACGTDWEITPEQELQERLALRRLSEMISGPFPH